MSFTPEFLRLLKERGEICESMSILHHYSHVKFSRLSNYTNIPVIIGSALISVIININLFEQQDTMIAFLSAIIGIIKTLDSYFSYTQRAETHRNISNQYKSISNFLAIQLSLENDKKIAYNDLLNIITNQLDSIQKSEPVIDEDIINIYKNKFKDETATKPPICNGLSNLRINSNETPTNTPIIKYQEKDKIKIGFEV